MDYLARREHSRAELVHKLAQKGYPDDEIDRQLARLAEEGLQSDWRFAESFAAQRARNGFGAMKIRYELERRGVAGALIDEALSPWRDSWLELAREQRERHFGDWPEDYRERARQSRYLQQRGYDFDVINRIFSDE